MLLLTGCGSGDTGATTTTVETLPPVSTAAPTTTTAAAMTTTTAPIDPASLLGTALETYATGYEFTATTSVNGQVASVQSGRWIGGASQLTVSSGDGEVEYIITADGQWARLAGAEWEELGGEPPTDNPLAAWATPESLKVTDSTSEVTVVAARYPAATLGLTGEPVEVTLTFTGTNLSVIAYTAQVDGNEHASQTTLSPPSDTTPIVAPA